MCRLSYFMIFAFLLCSQSSVSAAPVSEEALPDVVCPEYSGFLDGPFVAKPETARRIAEAIIEGIENRNRDNDYVLIVEDSGSHWEAFQSLKRNQEAIEAFDEDDEILTLTFGGGGIAMRIAKCDGAVSSVHFMR